MTPLVPDAFRPAPDISAADWVVSALHPWGYDRVRLWSFLPDGFEAYARVLHPAYRDEFNRGTVRWSELARRSGVELGPASSFREVSQHDPADDAPWYEAEPQDGNVDPKQLSTLAAALAPLTGTPERCFLAVWEGYGGWRPGISSTTLVAATSRWRGRWERFRLARRTRSRASDPPSTPRVETQHRAYFLFTGALTDVPTFAIGGWQQAPNIWWPADHAWCVATEIDGYSTYVGGARACIDAVIAAEEIEAIEVPGDVPHDPGPY